MRTRNKWVIDEPGERKNKGKDEVGRGMINMGKISWGEER